MCEQVTDGRAAAPRRDFEYRSGSRAVLAVSRIEKRRISAREVGFNSQVRSDELQFPQVKAQSGFDIRRGSNEIETPRRPAKRRSEVVALQTTRRKNSARSETLQPKFKLRQSRRGIRGTSSPKNHRTRRKTLRRGRPQPSNQDHSCAPRHVRKQAKRAPHNKRSEAKKP